MYSQNDEERIILNYFRGEPGLLLDIGANDGIILSNSLALMQAGWAGCFVEPSPAAFARLEALYEGKVMANLFNFALSDITGDFTFYESGEHLNCGDVALVSSLIQAETKRWTKETFREITVPAYRWEDTGLGAYKYDFITIDAEGMDYQILKQINLSHTSMVCIEWNQKKVLKDQINDYCRGFGMYEYYRNYENLIFAK